MLKLYVDGIPPYLDRFATWGLGAAFLSYSNSQLSRKILPKCAKRLTPLQLGVVAGTFSAIQFIFTLFDHPVSLKLNYKIIHHLAHTLSAYPVAELASSIFYGVFLIKNPATRYSLMTIGVANLALSIFVTLNRIQTKVKWTSFQLKVQDRDWSRINPHALRDQVKQNRRAHDCVPFDFNWTSQKETIIVKTVIQLIPAHLPMQSDVKYGSPYEDRFIIHISSANYKELKDRYNGLKAIKEAFLRHYNSSGAPIPREDQIHFNITKSLPNPIEHQLELNRCDISSATNSLFY